MKTTEELEKLFDKIAKEGMLSYEPKGFKRQFAMLHRCIMSFGSECSKNPELLRERDKMKEEVKELRDRIYSCRGYLMSVDPKDLRVEDCLENLGFNRNGH